MRILVYGINYAPELTGIGKYTAEMCAWFARQGHTVHVVTGMPYYPEWEVHKKYKGRLWHKEKMDGVTVYRCPLYIPGHITPMKRIIHEFSFLASIFPVWLKTLFQKKYDTVICVSPPFHLGFFPLLYSKIRRVNLITHIQDLQVDAAKNLVMIRNGHLLNMMFGAEKFILKRSTAVSTISTGMLKRIKAKNISHSKTILFPNWVDVNAVRPVPKEYSLRKEFGLGMEDKVILYSGNLGEKQGLEILIDTAKHFESRKDVHFVIVGSGGNKENLETLVKNEGLNNIRFYPLVPNEKLPLLLAMADLHLVLQKKSASDLVMPSKLTGILASGGCPVVTTEKGTSLYEMIDKHNLGILVKPESAFELQQSLEKALASDLSIYKRNARQFAVNYLSKDAVMRKFELEIYSRLLRKEILSFTPSTKIASPVNALSMEKN
jgi:colanic acid biosynthesis glycosyl transferase WcaI